MAQIKGANSPELCRIKDCIKDSYEYFRQNYDRYTHFMKFVFVTSLSQDDVGLMRTLNKPVLEFNILEAYLSRQCGEFAKQEPSLTLSRADDSKSVNPQLIEILSGHLRYILFESNRDNLAYDIFRDILGGGFSAFKVVTEYSNPMDFNQNIRIKRVSDPTMCGFDKMANESHKGDGSFCFELFPMTREDFEAKYGTSQTSQMYCRVQLVICERQSGCCSGW
jgi:hypothetical protein